jgi:hypothetical protein
MPAERQAFCCAGWEHAHEGLANPQPKLFICMQVYMLYELEPAKELTGGPWYGPDAFDSEFITVLQEVTVCQCFLMAQSCRLVSHIVNFTAWHAGHNELY